MCREYETWPYTNSLDSRPQGKGEMGLECIHIELRKVHSNPPNSSETVHTYVHVLYLCCVFAYFCVTDTLELTSWVSTVTISAKQIRTHFTLRRLKSQVLSQLPAKVSST